MTSAEAEGKSLHAICIDKRSGKLLHNVAVLTPQDAGPLHRLNGYASPTPVLDGERVYTHFGPRGSVCLDTAGKIIWKNNSFKYNVIQGAASSPILHGDMLILTCDGIDNQFIVALDKRTGKIKWKQPRAHLEAAAKKRSIAKMSYSTPLIQRINGVPQLVCSGAATMASPSLDVPRMEMACSTSWVRYARIISASMLSIPGRAGSVTTRLFGNAPSAFLMFHRHFWSAGNFLSCTMGAWRVVLTH